MNPPSTVLGGGVHGKVCWLIAYNRLSLNVKKTKYMLFRKQKSSEIRQLNLRISNDAIQSVNDFNFLGLHINSKLNWDTHTNVIGKRMSLKNN